MLVRDIATFEYILTNSEVESLLLELNLIKKYTPKYNILYKDDKQVIDNNTLTALTLLIAESNPKEKEIIIDLIMNFLS